MDPGEVRVSYAGLGELVDFALKNPEVMAPTRVLGLRERLRKGDRVAIEWQGLNSVRVAWITTRPLAELVPLPEETPKLEAALIVYELWESKSADSAGFAPLIDWLATEADGLQLPLWICSSEAVERLQDAAEPQGTRPILEVRRRRLFGRTVHESILGPRTDQV